MGRASASGGHPQTWANGTDSGTKQSEISCDPLRREYQVESSVLSFDSSAALLVAFSILTIMVAVRGRYQPVRKTVCSSRRIRNAVAVNVFLGLLTSWFLYTAAVNFERSALLLALSGKDNAAAGARATSFVYFAIAFAVLHQKYRSSLNQALLHEKGLLIGR